MEVESYRFLELALIKKGESFMEEFCIKLQSTIVNQRHSNIKTVVSDLNAKTGSDNTGYK